MSIPGGSLSRTARRFLPAAILLGLAPTALPRQQILHEIGGDQASDRLGDSVSGAGDVNADGYDDFIAGAPNSDRNGQNSGIVQVHSGFDGSVLYFYMGAAGDKLGESVSDAADINGDGYGDFIIGSPNRDVGGWSNPGRAYVRSGLTGSILFVFQGVSDSAKVGVSVSGAGDANNDGFCDVVVGSGKGTAWIRSGQTGGVVHTLTGHAVGVQPGWAVSGAGDVNGDGHDDVVCGDSGWQSSAGVMEVYSGVDGSVLFYATGSASGHNLGWSVSEAGDVNDDGFADVVAGGPAYGLLYGTARVYLGNTWTLRYEFDEQWASLGNSVGGAGDIDHDGHDDIVVGGPLAHSDGAVWAYSGADGSTLFTIDHAGTYDNLGLSVSAAGDVDGDGYADVILGAPVTTHNGIAFSGAILVASGDECGAIREIGTGCPGTGGFTPDLSFEGCMVVGEQLIIRLEDGPGGAPAALLMSTIPGTTLFPNGCQIELSLPVTLVPLGPLWGSGPGGGYWFTAATVPNLPGFEFSIGAVIKDGGNTITSNTLEIEIAP